MAKTITQELVFQSTDLAQWGEQVDAAQVHLLVQKYGVEECAELLQYLPPEKIQAVLDLDTWKRTPDARTDSFDKGQFLSWLKALLDGGNDFGVETLVALGPEYCAGVFSHYLDQTPMEIFSLRRMESGLAVEDKEIEHGDPLELGIYGGSYVKLHDDLCLDEVQDVFLELLGSFEEHAPEFLYGTFQLMFRSDNDAVLQEDLSWDRIGRLEAQGYTPAHKAREFLLRFRTEVGLRRFHPPSREGVWKREDTTSFIAFLMERFGASPEQGQLVIRNGKRPNAFEMTAAFLDWMSDQPQNEQLLVQQELGWLGNLFAGGWQVDGTPMKPQAAIKATRSTLELGLRHWMATGFQGESPVSAIDLFEMGWRYLYQKVSLPAARALDARLKARFPGNGELREIWFRACTRRRLKEFSMAKWIREGRYQLVRDILQELEYALPQEAAFLGRLMLDETPRVPARNTPYNHLEKITQKALLLTHPKQAEAPLVRLKEALREPPKG